MREQVIIIFRLYSVDICINHSNTPYKRLIDLMTTERNRSLCPACYNFFDFSREKTRGDDYI